MDALVFHKSFPLFFYTVIIVTQTVWNTPKYGFSHILISHYLARIEVKSWILYKYGKTWMKDSPYLGVFHAKKEIPTDFWYKSKRYSLTD